MTPSDVTRLDAQLHGLHLHYIQSHYQALATKAAEQQRSHLDYLEQLVEGEATMRENRSIERCIKNARFPVLKSVDDFQWNWPKKINRLQIQNLFRLAFIATQTNVVLIGNVGLGKTHLSIALGHAACLNGHSVLFTTAVDIINTLAAAQSAGRLKREFHRYLKPAVLIVDELGYLPIDKHGADLLFQIISQRYERAPMVITTNRAYKQSTNRRVDVIREGFDIAIRVRFPPLDEDDLIVKVLSESPQRLVATRQVLEGRSLPLVPADLSALPSLSWGSPHQDQEWYLEGPEGATARIPHRPRFITEDMVALQLAALRGGGVVQMPTTVVRKDLADGTLIDVLPGWAPRAGIVHAVFPSRRGLLPSVRALLDFLAAEYVILSRAGTKERREN
jgi:DNA replication protein DnaC